MKYIISFVFLLSLLSFTTPVVLSEDQPIHQTLEERKQENYETRKEMPTLPVSNPAIQDSAVRNAEQNQVIQDTRSPRDEQKPRDRQAVLCDPKFGGSPNDPGCQKPAPTPGPGPVTPPQGGPGPNNPPTTSENPPTSPTGGGSSSSGAAVIGLSNTSGAPFPVTNIFGIICLAKGLILVKKSLLN